MNHLFSSLSSISIPKNKPDAVNVMRWPYSFDHRLDWRQISIPVQAGFAVVIGQQTKRGFNKRPQNLRISCNIITDALEPKKSLLSRLFFRCRLTRAFARLADDLTLHRKCTIPSGCMLGAHAPYRIRSRCAKLLQGGSECLAIGNLIRRHGSGSSVVGLNFEWHTGWYSQGFNNPPRSFMGVPNSSGWYSEAKAALLKLRNDGFRA